MQFGKSGGIVASNMVGETVAYLTAEFEEVRQLNLRSPSPLWHVSLSLAPGEYFTDWQWQEVVEKFIDRVGKMVTASDEIGINTQDNQYVAIRHIDTLVKEVDGVEIPGHDHVHLLLNRITFAGKVAYCR